MHDPRRRFVYVLTVWEERPASEARPAVWRFSLEDTHARHRLGFGSLSDLTAFLRQEITISDKELHEQGD